MDHTTNYNLPLYTAQDETNYMTNWNGAMTSIDAAVKEVDDKPMVDQTARDNISSIESELDNIGFSAPTKTPLEGNSFTAPKTGSYTFSANVSRGGQQLTIFLAVVNGIQIGRDTIESTNDASLMFINSLLLKKGTTVYFYGQEGQTVSSLNVTY